MIPRPYNPVFAGTITSAGGDVDVFTLIPADDRPICLVGGIFGQTSELGDTAEENVALQVLYVPATVTNGSGGNAAAAPAKIDPDDPTAGFTFRSNDTTLVTSSGTIVTVYDFAWNLRGSPYEWFIPENRRPVARQGQAIVLRIPVALADDISARLTLYVDEY